MSERTLFRQIADEIDNDNIEEVTALIEADPSRLEMDTPFGTWLIYAATNGKLAIVKRLVSMGANVNACGGMADANALEAAARTGFLDIVKYLFSSGSELDVSKPERNPLFATVYDGHVEIARYLLEVGVDPHVTYRSVTGKLKNALSYAEERGQSEIVELLRKAGCTLPTEEEAGSQTASHDTRHQRIIAHLADELGPVNQLALQEILPVHDAVHVAINVIPANRECPYLTAFTTGMSDQPMKTPPGEEAYQYAELVMHLPSGWQLPNSPAADGVNSWPLEWLRKIAYFPHLNNTWLGGPHTIIATDEPPVPLGPNTQQSCLLLLADFGQQSPLVLDNGTTIHFYTVVPLYSEERDFEKTHGIVPLLQRLQERGLSAVIDVDRENTGVER